MAPAFTPRRIAGYGKIMAARAHAYAEALAPHTMIDISSAMMSTTLDIVGRTLFDVDLHGDARAIADALTDAMEYMVKAGMWLVPASLPLPRNTRVRTSVGRLDETVLRIIAERRAALEQGSDDRGDVLSILLTARDDDGRARLVGDGTQHWTTVHVDDLAALYVLVLELGSGLGHVIGVSGSNPTVGELGRAVAGAAGIHPETADGTRVRLGGPFADALLLDQQASGAKARSLGWAPTRRTLLEEFTDGSYGC
jgi:hypothetical protein